MRNTALAAAVAAILLSANLGAQPAPVPGKASTQADASTADDSSVAQDNPRLAQAREILASLKFQQGNIAVPGSDAHFNLGPDFRYLGKVDTRKVLEQLWRNPPDDSVLGLVVPAKTTLVDKHAWAVVITRTDEGHVADAEKTDYAAMLKKLQQETVDSNPERANAGYPQMTLVGWAEPPHYDAANKKLYWARELAFSDTREHTLNYDIRVLGRTGYISLSAVADMNDIAVVRSGMNELLPMVEFDQGKRYADFDSSHDKLAAYGLGALVAGGIAAKAGLFAKLGVILLAAKKFIILAVVAIGAWVKKLFGGDRNKPGPTVR